MGWVDGGNLSGQDVYLLTTVDIIILFIRDLRSDKACSIKISIYQVFLGQLLIFGIARGTNT